jgi:type I restriction enzyme, S subunit
VELNLRKEQTQFDHLPEQWEVKRFGEIAKFRTGPFGSALHKSDYISDGIPVINPMHIVEGKIEPTSLMTISDELAGRLSDFRLKAGEIIIGRRGDMGRCAVVHADQAGWLCGTGSMIIRLDERADTDFFQRVLSSPRAISAITDASVGTTMANLNQETLARLFVQFPPLEEQHAIASALSDVDALLEGLQRLIVKKRDLKQAAMQQLLTGRMRLGEFEGKWEVKTLNELCQKIQDGTHFSPKPGGSDYLYVTSKNVRFGTLDMSTAERISATEHAKIYARCDVKPGDLLLTKDGANTGNAALNTIDEPFSLLSSVALLRFDQNRHSPRFFLYQILSTDGQRQIKDMMSGNAITRLTLAKINALQFAVPSFQEQAAIADALTDMDAELETLRQRLAKTRDLKQAMMQGLLTGKTRLAVAEAVHA